MVGVSFFRSLVLSTTDSHVAFYASMFLLEVLKKQQPEQYTSVMDTILHKAVEANDEALLFNPYLQIKAIMKLHVDSKK